MMERIKLWAGFAGIVAVIVLVDGLAVWGIAVIVRHFR